MMAVTIFRMIIAPTTVDKPATPKVNYEKTYYSHFTLFNARGHPVDLVRIGSD